MEALYGASGVSPSDASSSTKRSEPSATTPEPENSTFVSQKDLIIQQRSLASPSPVSCEDICQLQSYHKEVTELAGTNYKTYVSVVLNAQNKNKLIILNRTSAGPNLVNRSILQATWKPRVKRRDFLVFGSANNQPITSQGVILLRLSIGNLRIRTWYGVVEIPGGDLLLGTPFTARYVQDMCPAEQKLVPWHS